MSKLHIDVAEHGAAITVSQMRRTLARALAKLKGDAKTTFSFHCQIEVERKGDAGGHDGSRN
jgi:hypothetical protein